MANYSWSSTAGASTEPMFRAWAQGISAALAAIGMVRVEASASASNWTVAFAGWSASPTGTEYAWEVWAFPSSATQTASPLFIRVGYQMSATVSATPQLTMKFATAQGSGGVVTGIGGSGTIAMTPGAGATTQSAQCFAACDGHGLVIAHSVDNTNNPSSVRSWLVVDRYRNPNGTPQNGGLSVFRGYHLSNTIYHHNFDLVANEYVATTFAYAPCLTQGGLQPYVSNFKANGEAQLWPWWSSSKNGHGVSKMIATYANNDMVALVNQSVSWLPSTGSATTRTVKPLGVWISNSCHDAYQSSGASLAIWWSD